MMLNPKILLISMVACILLSSCLLATPDFLQHNPGNHVYGEAAGVTMREEEVPREDEAVTLWVQVGYSNYYTDVAIYYTTDGNDPQGSFGSPGSASTSVLRSSTGGVTFVRNEPYSPANVDWWKAILPPSTRAYGLTIKYKISAWHSSGGPEIFANNTGCSDGTCDNALAPAAVFSYPVRLAWPGMGSPNSNPGTGYPNIHLWKEEAVVGNNWMNVQLDQNGSIYDVYYPSAGCVQGMGTKNEGYVDGNDTFPPGLPLDNRGQMNMNMGCIGLRVNGITYWLTNEGGAYSGVSQSYVDDTNIIQTTQTLAVNGYNIGVRQYDFCPKGTGYPTDSAGAPIRGIHTKRVILTNNGSSARTLNFYYFADPAINGGDGYDVMSFDRATGAMITSDTTYRTTSSSREYNPTSFSDYTKNISINFAWALKLCTSGASGTPATDCWRDSSADNSQGWIGLKLTLAPGESKEVDLATIGGFKQGANDPGTPSIFNGQIVPALAWINSTDTAALQDTTYNYWTNWLASGTSVTLPDNRYNSLFKRSLLATALHVDEKGGGVIAGMHNGAYPFIWPRDAVYAAITLDRTGHFAEAANVYRFLKDVAYRSNEEPGRKGFWYQKYTTDGYMVWTAPQVDETAVVPWGVKYHFDVTGDFNFINTNYQMAYEAARASSEDNIMDSRLYYDDLAMLMHSNNVWEDSWDNFLYSNACVERGLKDAAALAGVTGHGSDQSLFNSRANSIHSGILNRLAWDGENTDISQLGLVYPYESLAADDTNIAHILSRMNGSAQDRWGNIHPITNSSGEFAGLINRYYGDNYWNGGPWFLSTLWYGEYYAKRQDYNPGKADVDVLKSKIDLLLSRLGPVGLGAEQIAPNTSLLYPDFSLQAAWPNAWESMSTLVDSIMLFLDFKPNAPTNSFSISPKLPTDWSTITFNNLRAGSSSFDVTCSESAYESTQVFTTRASSPLDFSTIIRIPGGVWPKSVTVNGVPVIYNAYPDKGQVQVNGMLSPNAITAVKVFFADVPEKSVQEVKSLPNGTAVILNDVVVTRVHSDRFNVETADRSAGLAVIGGGVNRSENVSLYGTVDTSGAEQVLRLTSIIRRTTAPVIPCPLAMAARSAGGSDFGNQKGVSGGAGLNNIGLDVKLFGKVEDIASNGSYIVINDGSGLHDASGMAGIKLIGALNTDRFKKGDYVTVAGSLSIYQSGDIYYPLLRIAAPEDIQ